MISAPCLKSFVNQLFPVERDSVGAVSIRRSVHRCIYYLLLLALVCAQPVSNYLMSATQILLAINWALEWDMKRKFSKSNINEILIAFLVLYLVHLLWLIPTSNYSYGWYVLFKRLPLLSIPVVVLTSKPLNRHQFFFLFFGLVTTVFVATLIGWVRFVSHPDLPYRQIFPFISHIRFSLNVCLSLTILAWASVYFLRRHSLSRFSSFVLSPLSLYLLVALDLVAFLLLIRSYTAFVILFAELIILACISLRRPHSLAFRRSFFVVGLCLVVFLALLISCVRDYYRMVPLAQAPLPPTTLNGNPYHHSQDGLIENGNYVNNYVCICELDSEWSKRSSLSVRDTTPNGYTIFPTLVRYLNAKGVTKDSLGIQSLTNSDIESIERGIANPVYVGRRPLKRMVFVMLYEFESYRKLHAVKDFTMLQRFELWKTAWHVFCSHPLFGVGTGDLVDACHHQLALDHSPLIGTTKHTHNQYLSLLVAFGSVGFVFIFASFLWALCRQRLFHSSLFVAYLTILLVSFITEDTIETLAGCVFATLFFVLIAHHQSLLSESGDCSAID